MFVVYILYSEIFNKTYCGYTNDLERRLKEHNITSVTGYTLKYRPWCVIKTELFETRQSAKIKEKYYKTGVGRELIKMIVTHYNNEKLNS